MTETSHRPSNRSAFYVGWSLLGLGVVMLTANRVALAAINTRYEQYRRAGQTALFWKYLKPAAWGLGIDHVPPGHDPMPIVRAYLARNLIRGVGLILTGLGLVIRRPWGWHLALWPGLLWALKEIGNLVQGEWTTQHALDGSWLVLLIGLWFWLFRPRVRAQFHSAKGD
ncbi:MAG: hypothetical protein HYZ92_06290 [Candidatus Omnitrophica bacterium]|nr:hypothetical protein [Candidatus Omnitrophota bacterium]